MWSAKHIALLCMVVNQDGRKQGRDTGVFCLSVLLSAHPFFPLKFSLSDLKSALPGLKSERAAAYLRPERTGFRPEGADFRPEGADFRSERAD